MKKAVKYLTVLLISSMTMVACAQDKKAGDETANSGIVQKESKLEMSKDTLYARIIAEIEKEIVKRKIELTEQTLATIGDTRSLLQEVVKGDDKTAIKKGKELIGSLEVLLAKDPSLALIPVNVSYRTDELVADIETVKEQVKLAKTAMKKGYYQEAAAILSNLRSEVVISTYLIPAATYPQAIKAAVVTLEEGDKIAAAAILQEVLSTIVIETNELPLPVLKAEQMIIEAAAIDAKDHEHVDAVVNLLKNADYQLKLAEELGYGKKDKDFKALNESIDALIKSVKKKADSKNLFDNMKADIKKFQDRLFPKNKNK